MTLRTSQKIARQSALMGLAAFFSWATVILAAGPLKAIRISGGPLLFWGGALIVGSTMALLVGPVSAAGFGAVVLLVGLDHELNTWGVGRGVSATASILALTGVVGTVFGAFLRTQKLKATSLIESLLKPGIERLKELYPQSADVIQVDQIVGQIPSVLVVSALFTLALAHVTYGTWLRLARGLDERNLNSADALASNERSPSIDWVATEWRAAEWQQFRVWEPLIFVLMAALLAAFLEHPYPMLSTVGVNVVNVVAVLYFFQGLAVAFYAMDWFRFGPVGRLLAGFVLIFQLGLIVGLLGVADYWLDLRRRMDLRSAKQKENYKSNLR